ncbi:hypothetical protein D3C87_1904170 [compost metagenome]
MRQVKQALHHPFGQHVPDFIEQHRQNDGSGEAENQLVESDDGRISQYIVEILVREQKGKVVEADPLASYDPLHNLIILEGDHAPP